MTTKQHCANELKRIPANLPGGPETPEDRAQYLDVFHRHADDAGHAKAVVDRLIESSEWYPRPADIVRVCREIRAERAGAGDLPAGCDDCHGEAWVQVQVRGEWAVRRCVCARGSYLASRDRERRNAESERRASNGLVHA